MKKINTDYKQWRMKMRNRDESPFIFSTHFSVFENVVKHVLLCFSRSRWFQRSLCEPLSLCPLLVNCCSPLTVFRTGDIPHAQSYSALSTVTTVSGVTLSTERKRAKTNLPEQAPRNNNAWFILLWNISQFTLKGRLYFIEPGFYWELILYGEFVKFWVGSNLFFL